MKNLWLIPICLLWASHGMWLSAYVYNEVLPTGWDTYSSTYWWKHPMGFTLFGYPILTVVSGFSLFTSKCIK